MLLSFMVVMLQLLFSLLFEQPSNCFITLSSYEKSQETFLSKTNIQIAYKKIHSYLKQNSWHALTEETDIEWKTGVN